MLFFRKRKQKNCVKVKTEAEIKAEKVLRDFAEGKISVYAFWEIFQTDSTVRDLIYNDEKLPTPKKPFIYENLDLNILYHRCEIFRVVKCYFLRRQIGVDFYNIDSTIYVELLNVAPRYVNINSAWFYENILEKCEYEIGSKERKIWVKEKIKESFRCRSRPPRWLQSPEWPIGSQGPLIFIRQDNSPNNIYCDSIHYFFYDEVNKKEVVIEQYT